MIQSTTPMYLKCQNCYQTPKQFTVLLCNHVFCAGCIYQFIQKTSKKYTFIKCVCGGVTYFNELNQIIDTEQTLSDSHVLNNDKKNDKVQQQNNKDNNNTRQYLSIIHNPKKQIYQRSTMPILQASSVYSLHNKSQCSQINNFSTISPTKKQRYLNNHIINTISASSIKYKNSKQNKLNLNRAQEKQIEESLLLENNQYGQVKDDDDFESRGRKRMEKQKQSKNEKVYQQQQQCKLVTKKTKQTQPSAFSHSPLHFQFKNQLQFLQILFKKSLQQIQQQFKKLIENITIQYDNLQRQLKSLYLQNFITSQSIQKINLSELIRKRYEFKIGDKLKIVQNQLMMMLNGQIKEKLGRNLSELRRFQVVDEKKAVNKREQKRNTFDHKNYDYETFSEFDNYPKRLKTQNLHTEIKRNSKLKFLQKDQIFSRPTCHQAQVKNNLRSLKRDSDDQMQRLRREFIYYSPAIGYCERHLEKRSKERKNYLSYIEKLCHERKMKNNRELFKKNKLKNVNEFRR